MTSKSANIKIAIKKNATAALTRQLLKVPEGGKTITVGIGDKQVTFRASASEASSTTKSK
jgi:hypothetical protein